MKNKHSLPLELSKYSVNKLTWVLIRLFENQYWTDISGPLLELLHYSHSPEIYDSEVVKLSQKKSYTLSSLWH
jgi:hypothetical protein